MIHHLKTWIKINMENTGILLWIPLIVIAAASVIKMLKEKTSSGKPWIRIEEVDENE